MEKKLTDLQKYITSSNAAAESGILEMDLHTHTLAGGHGTADTITDMARAAAAKGVKLLGISDHGPATPGASGVSYFRSLRLAERSRFGIRLLYGAEANILDREGHLDLPDDILKTLDYVIISMHLPVYTPGTAAENTAAYIRAMEHPGVRFLGHCDDPRFPIDFRQLLQAAASRRIYPELNNMSLLPDSYRKGCRPNSLRLLSQCAVLGCPILVSSDSHGTEHIGEAGEALRLLEAVDFPRDLILSCHSF